MAIPITWANHNRAGQADNLVAWSAGSTGSEPGEHRALRVWDSGDVLLAEKLDIATDAEAATVTTTATGTLRFKLWSIRDGLDSLHAVEWTSEHPTPDPGPGTAIIAETWYPPVTPPSQPHGEQLVADGVTPH